MNSTQLFLDQLYELDGLTLTGEEIRERIITGAILMKHFKELKGDSE